MVSKSYENDFVLEELHLYMVCNIYVYITIYHIDIDAHRYIYALL